MNLRRSPLLIEANIRRDSDYRSERSDADRVRKLDRQKQKRIARRDRRRIAKLRAKQRGKFAPLGPTDPAKIKRREKAQALRRSGTLAAPNMQERPEGSNRYAFTKAGRGVSNKNAGNSTFSQRNRDPLDPLGGPRSLFV